MGQSIVGDHDMNNCVDEESNEAVFPFNTLDPDIVKRAIQAYDKAKKWRTKGAPPVSKVTPPPHDTDLLDELDEGSNERHDGAEADIVINGRRLDYGQAMTVRVSLGLYKSSLMQDGPGDDEHGRIMFQLYMCRLNEIQQIMRGPRLNKIRAYHMERPTR